MYPKADVPVIQLSLNRFMTLQEHYDLGKQLKFLRQQGVLIIGSGNIVHNLGKVAWEKFTEIGYAYDWNKETTTKVKNSILQNDHQYLIQYQQQGSAFQLSVPIPEHYLPLLYILAMKQSTDQIHFFNDQAVAGSLSMLSVMFK